MAEIYILTSDGVPLAQFENEESDMWYLMGKISSIQSSLVTLNEIFQATQDLDFKAVMCDWSQGYRCELKAEANIIPCVLMECNPQQAILRMLTAQETIAWSQQNLQPLPIAGI
ncbi:hypothetical protein ACSYAD_15450 [Acaryochloris marina NIES-2412]|uniref:hypothetical protein n=1 Tax=Acaryochloris marina TaxID=155978 RepID=UPI0040588E51